MKTYYMERDEGTEVQEYRADDTQVYHRFASNPNYFIKVSEYGENYIFDWKHAGGSGRVRIPGHILFDLPELLAIWNHAKNGRMFDSVRIYDRKPIMELFKK